MASLIWVRKHASAPRTTPHLASLEVNGIRLPCRIGRSGISFAKREGDGATPCARLRALRGFYRADRRLAMPTRLPMRPIRHKDGWCDAVGHGQYNRLVRRPLAASHEHLWREDGLYDVVLDLDWNHSPRRQGRGSAIFLHLMRANGGPTEGCIAVPARRIAWLLARLTPSTTFIVGQMGRKRGSSRR